MAAAKEAEAGTVASIWRYPVKSMRGEELPAAALGEHGLAGDRAYALQDRSDGKIATAKNPRKWPNLFAFRSALVEGPGGKAPALRITLPDGRVVAGEQGDADQVLSKAVNRSVALAAAGHRPASAARTPVAESWTGKSEQYWPDMEGLERRDDVTDFALPAGTFFDCAAVHLLTTATIERLRRLYPEGRFDARRFRPNIVVEHNQARVGVYAAVVRGGTVRRGDRVRLSAA